MYSGYNDRLSRQEALDFHSDVLNIVSQIPYGSVATYGAIASLSGHPSHARMVGRILKYAPESLDLPCHRVVNAVGRTAPGWQQHRYLLEREGVEFRQNGNVDMQKHLWLPDIE